MMSTRQGALNTMNPRGLPGAQPGRLAGGATRRPLGAG
jgi:hypothetical protein